MRGGGGLNGDACRDAERKIDVDFDHVDDVSFFVAPDAGHDVFDEERSSFARLFDILAVRRFVDGFWLAASFLKNFRKVR